jgi:serine O-acetyltransferase
MRMKMWHNAGMARDFYSFLVDARNMALFGKPAYYLLKALGVELPRSVSVGRDLTLEHGGFGIVVHSWTRIGNRVKIYPGVTMGRADIYRPIEQSGFKGVVVEDDVILCPGCKILGKDGELRLGRGSVIGANAVLFESTGENEIWAGIPARRLGFRPASGEAGIDPV